jgi:methyl-accepting chemotaxis protein
MTTPSLEKATQKLADGARNAGRSTVALLRDGGYATIGATDAAVAYVRRIGERAEQVREDLPEQLKALRNPSDLTASLRELGSNVEERFGALAGRGREVVETLQHSGPTRDALARTRAASEQVKAAATNIRRGGEASTEAAEASANAVSEAVEEAADKDSSIDYASLTVDQLRDLARERGIPGRHDMNKSQLISVLRKS